MIKETEQSLSWYVRFLALYFVLLMLGAVSIGTLGSVLRYIGLIPALFGIVQLIRTRTLWVHDLTRYVFLFTVWATFSVIWSLDSDTALSSAWSYITFSLLVLSAFGQVYNERDTISQIGVNLGF